MAVEPGDVFEVKVKYKYEGQEMANVFAYEYALLIDPLGTTYSQVLAERFEELMLPKILPLFPTQVAFTGIDVRDVVFPDDAYELPLAVTGAAVWADRLPRHDTVGFVLNGALKSTRRGGKRVGILNESVVTNGVVSFGSTLGAIVALQVQMALPITTFFIFTQNTFQPVIIKRVREGVEGAYTYRLPDTRAEQVLNRIISVGVSYLMTTQNSRKR